MPERDINIKATKSDLCRKQGWRVGSLQCVCLNSPNARSGRRETQLGDITATLSNSPYLIAQMLRSLERERALWDGLPSTFRVPDITIFISGIIYIYISLYIYDMIYFYVSGAKENQSQNFTSYC